MNDIKFTPQHIANFKQYLRVQERGRYNMFDPRAREATGLSATDYVFILRHYEALAKLAWAQT